MDKMEIGTEIVWQGRTYALDGDVGAQTLRFAAKTFCGTVYGDRTAAAARALVVFSRDVGVTDRDRATAGPDGRAEARWAHE